MSEQVREHVAMPIRKLPVVRSTDDRQPETGEDGTPSGVECQIELRQQRKQEISALFAEEIDEVFGSAKSHGYKEGFDAATADARETLDSQRQKLEQEYADKLAIVDEQILALRKLMDGMAAAGERAFDDMEPAVVAIAYASLTRLFGKAEHYRSLLSDLVRHALEQFRHSESFRILMSETDVAILKAVDSGNAWLSKLVVEPAMQPGDCVIESGPRSLDASLMRQFDLLRQCLLATCEERHDADH